MKSSHRFLQLLNIYPDEWSLVKKLFGLQFFQGAGIALFFTSAISQFLDKFPIEELAWVFILSAFLLWIAGIISNQLEHKLRLQQLSLVMTLIMAGSMLFFWVGAFFELGNWYYYLMLAWFNVLYLINNLEFWGLAAQLYDVRQSKRLFGVISSGDIPAKFIGYTIALLAIPLLGTQNLLLAGTVGMLFSLIFLRTIFRSSDLAHLSHHTQHIKQHQTAGFKAMLKNITGNKLVFRTAILSMIAFAGFVLIEYAFYAEIKESDSYKSDVSFASFIALFMASARLIAWIFKLGFTSRIVASIGNRSALLITPIAVFVLMVTVLITYNLNAESKLILYVFGVAAILVDALRASINSPVLLTILQPLSTPDRLRAHNIVKGIMDPFAYLLIGLLLLFLYQQDYYQLSVLCAVIILVSVIWAAYVFLLQKQYLITLIKAISSRYFSKDEFNLSDKETLDQITAKIKSGTELEVLYLLRMLDDEKSILNEPLIISALQHPSTNVSIAAMNLVEHKKIIAAKDELKKLTQNTDPELQSKAIQVLATIAYDQVEIVSFLSADSLSIQAAAMIGILKHGTTAADKKPASDLLKQLSVSSSADERLVAVQVITAIADTSFEPAFELLLMDTDKAVQKAAIQSIHEHTASTAIAQLSLLYQQHEKEVTKAFVRAGVRSLAEIKQLLTSSSIIEKQRQQLLLVCSKIKHPEAAHFLLTRLAQYPADASMIIKALYKAGFLVTPASNKLIEQITRDYLLRAAELLFMLNRTRSEKEIKPYLFNSLQLELSDIRENLLNCFSFYCGKEQIDKIKKALYLNKKELAANAFELIEVTIKKEYASTFNTAFEDTDLQFRCAALKKLVAENSFKDIPQVLTRVLKEEKVTFNHWTKACSLHTSRHHRLAVEPALIAGYLESAHPLLRETAAFAQQEIKTT